MFVTDDDDFALEEAELTRDGDGGDGLTEPELAGLSSVDDAELLAASSTELSLSHFELLPQVELLLDAHEKQDGVDSIAAPMSVLRRKLAQCE
eukprot:4388092-Pleurochrysis_carterae.AAC.1